MKDTIKKYIVWSAAAMMFAACSGNEGETTGTDERVPVEFSASVGVTETRAIDQSWSPTDAIGIYMVNKDAELKDANISEGAANIRYVVNTGQANGFKADGTTIYYPMDGSAVDFYAYYPQTADAVKKDDTSGNYVYALNVATQTNQEALDFMYSSNVKDCSKTNKAAGLSFYHQLCKMVLTVKPGAGVSESDLAGLTVKVNGQNTTATFDLTAGKLETDASNSADITFYKQAEKYIYEAILLPSTDASRTFEFDLNNSYNTPFTWNMNKELPGGSKYTYTVKLNRSGVEVTGDIQPWNEENGGEVDAH